LKWCESAAGHLHELLTVLLGSSLFSFVALCKNCSGQRAVASCGAKLFQHHRCLVAASHSGPHDCVFSMRKGYFLVRESISILEYVELFLRCRTALHRMFDLSSLQAMTQTLIG
jgi:hypothetical protein